MVQVRNAFTTELDEPEDALKEILEQIDLKTLSKNSVGIIVCYYEFIDTGVVQKISESLPFEVIGLTTTASASKGDYGMYRLNLTVLTSDDILFETAYTVPLSRAEYEKPLEEAYAEARAGLPSDPSFIITIFPLMGELIAPDILKVMDRASKGIPIWGTIASDAVLDSEHCKTIGKKKSGATSVAMLLLHGDIEPEFIVTSIPDRNISTRKALVTKSSGCIVQEANGVPFAQYLNSIGYITKVGIDPTSFPLIMRFPDGSGPVALGVFRVFEDGSILMGGEVPEGTSFSGGEIDPEGIIETARASLDKALKTGKRSGIFMSPCITRYLMLSPVSSKEMELAISTIGDIPYFLAYASGEICPVRGEDGKLYNHFHNFTFSLCVL
ncbi:FIST C-terminal domain-containing protein [Leadbettera azotonutricia]|uniref:FIST C-domain domain-containing protein n=1 Tax=Leadbettera azotonutricia (strain ATCC BAA-888 / DSM 13862 / ZAS-9) TaxID=545695 RepID=F5YA20_LEAAZ|nr:FIST C-terminal domain-containing protein [Leadbettera azotonutricia]AEF83034.1 hypothetical protein TREAZ_2041 [Leadbettera azotonutricia ZAS-9]